MYWYRRIRGSEATMPPKCRQPQQPWEEASGEEDANYVRSEKTIPTVHLHALYAYARQRLRDARKCFVLRLTASRQLARTSASLAPGPSLLDFSLGMNPGRFMRGSMPTSPHNTPAEGRRSATSAMAPCSACSKPGSYVHTGRPIHPSNPLRPLAIRRLRGEGRGGRRLKKPLGR